MRHTALPLLFFCVAGCGGGDAQPDATVPHDAGDAGASDAPATDLPTPPPDMSPDTSTGCTDDADSDGHRSLACGGADCDETDPDASPGNHERCDTLCHE